MYEWPLFDFGAFAVRLFVCVCVCCSAPAEGQTVGSGQHEVGLLGSPPGVFGIDTPPSPASAALAVLGAPRPLARLRAISGISMD